MPLTKRLVEPVCVGREKIPAGVKNELEFVTNSTLANVILQLSNLSRHAEDLFSEIHGEAASCIQRSAALQNRIDRLTVKVTQLDSTAEEVTLQDINRKKQFRSSNVQSDRVVSRITLPNAMRDIYEECDTPPPLNKLNPYRTDGREGMKFYTDPDYFFDLWKKNMLEGGEKQKAERARKPGRSRASSENRATKVIRQPPNHLDQMRAKTLGQESNYSGSPVPQPAVSPPGPRSGYPYASDQYGMVHNVPPAASYDANKYGTIRSQSRPGRLDLPPPYETVSPDSHLEETVHMIDYRAPGNFAAAVQTPQPQVSEAVLRANTRGTPTRPNQPPPAPPSTGSGTLSTRSSPASGKEVFPPPPPEMQGRHSPTPPPTQDFPPPPSGGVGQSATRGGGSVPPPPPPPPPGFMGGASKASTVTDSSVRQKSVESNPPSGAGQASTSKSPAPVKVGNTMVDTRSALLAEIQSGMRLRKIEHQKNAVTMESSLHNVAEILARRKAIQDSDSDASDETEDDGGWDEHH